MAKENWKVDEDREVAWRVAVARKTPINLTASDMDAILAALYRVTSAVLKVNTAESHLRLGMVEASAANLEESRSEANLALETLNEFFADIKMRPIGSSDD